MRGVVSALRTRAVVEPLPPTNRRPHGRIKTAVDVETQRSFGTSARMGERFSHRPAKPATRVRFSLRALIPADARARSDEAAALCEAIGVPLDIRPLLLATATVTRSVTQ